VDEDTRLDLEQQGIIFNIQSYSIHDGPGIRTVVFLKGCPLECFWCSNPESQNLNPELGVSPNLCKACGTCVERCPYKAVSLSEEGLPFTDPAVCILCGRCEIICPHNARKLYGKKYSIDQLIGKIEKDMPFFIRSGGGVTFSGGEPTVQYDFLLGALKACRKRFVHTAVETCGYMRDRTKLENLLNYLDLVLYDIKCMDGGKHERYTGVSNKLILDNAHLISSSGTEMIIRVPIIPGFNDSEDEMKRIAEFVLSLSSVEEVNLLPYHELGKTKYGMLNRTYGLQEAQGIPDSRIKELQAVMESFGLQCDVD
jgi:pyruvate formate lyase activating enzyme